MLLFKKKNMKKKYLLIGAFCASLLSACQSDMLELNPLDSFSDAAVWSDLALVETFVNNQYNGIYAESVGGPLRCGWCDDAYFMHNYATNEIVQGRLSPDNYGLGWGDMHGDPWKINYDYLRNTNMFFEKIEQVPVSGKEEDALLKEQLIGQMYFMRAYFYFDLYQFFGGVPLITRTFKLDDDFLSETRATKEAVMEYIVSQCDSAALYLPVQYAESEDFGRATKGAALALKARTLLFGASALFGVPSAEKWQRASDANLAVINLKDDGGNRAYDLVQVSDADDYANIFIDQNNEELIFMRLFNNNYDGQNLFIYTLNEPSGYDGWGGMQPTQMMVDEFEMKDGTMPVKQASTTVNPYMNRDLRFDATVSHDGTPWKKRNVETFVPDPSLPTAVQEKLPKGADSRQGSAWWNGTHTGYYLKKFLDPDYYLNSGKSATTPWILFRLGEIYLNYAECQMELGNNGEALQYINLIRARAHQPAIGAATVEAYRHERRIELAFEGHRYFDMRRWKIMDQVLTKNVDGMDVFLQEDGVTKKYVRKYDLQLRYFNEKNYWVPIPRYELRRAPQLDPAPYN